MHDGSQQWVPSIRSITSLDVAYPVCISLSPEQPWTMVIVNAKTITTLLLSIRLSPPEWSKILGALTLPSLHDIGIWADTITSETATSFLNRHDILTLKYMSSATIAPLPAWRTPLTLPNLRKLTARAHYVVHILRSRTSAPLLFPKLEHVELWVDTSFYDALRLISAHPPLRRVSLWQLRDFDIAQWPVFPSVEAVKLYQLNGGEDPDTVDLAELISRTVNLPVLLAHAFPTLRRLHIIHTFPKGSSNSRRPKAVVQRQAIRKAKQELVRRIARVNPGVVQYAIDKELFEP
ncbi:hypothetical protein C8R43DRAFT_1016831 [Mycena crocata]|nr:hypothetical protein C8R43DRAFT_1016831 [Mycena crocata]